eukprot:scaffold14559_cov39-Isochrysis_galbana.AAC.1
MSAVPGGRGAPTRTPPPSPARTEVENCPAPTDAAPPQGNGRPSLSGINPAPPAGTIPAPRAPSAAPAGIVAGIAGAGTPAGIACPPAGIAAPAGIANAGSMLRLE